MSGVELVPHRSGGFTVFGDPGESGHGTAPRLSVTVEEGDWLAVLAHKRKVLEIGTGTGYSASRMAATASLVVTCDTSEWVQAAVWPRLHGVVKVAYTSLAKDLAPFDMVFVDGSHAPPQPELDWEESRSLVAKGGLAVFHDAKAVDLSFLPFHKVLDTEHGLALVAL